MVIDCKEVQSRVFSDVGSGKGVEGKVVRVISGQWTIYSTGGSF